MTCNPAIRRLLVLVALGSVASACADAAPGPVEPPRPTASLVGSVPELVVSTVQAGTTLVSATIGAAGGTLRLPGGHSLVFPAGALPQSTTISAVLDGSEVEVEFGPHGLVFPDSALPTLTFSYADAVGVSDANAHALRIVYLDASGNVQEVLPTSVDTEADVVHARLRHFSTYALVTD